MFAKNENFDIITPHRFSLCVLIQDFIKFRNSDDFKFIEDESLRAKYRKDFSKLVLKLIQYPDLELEELWNLLLSSNYQISDYVKAAFQQSLQEIGQQGLGYLLDVVEGFTKIMAFNDTTATMDPEKAFFSKSSPIGSYMRRLILNFDKLSFSEVTAVYLAFQLYVNSSCPLPRIPDENKLLNIDTFGSEKDLWTRRQAEMFIGKQVDLLQVDVEAAASPKDVQNAAINILKTNPDLAEAHFMNYLNCARVREFCGARDSLYHYFDKHGTSDSKNEDKPKSCRFAALNLAILHYNFGHHDEAVMSLHEAIRNAQEANDNTCLQHAFLWLYRLVMHQDRLIPLSKHFFQLSTLLAEKPSVIFDTLMKFDMINDKNVQFNAIANSYSLKSCLWTFFGKNEMTNLWSQLFLNINSLKKPFGEASCLSLCNVANYLAAQGEYLLAHCALRLAKTDFPNEPNSLIWMEYENNVLFVQALYNEDWAEAEKAAQRLTIVDKIESYLRLAELYLHKLDYVESSRYIRLILQEYETDDKFKSKETQLIRAKLLLVEIQFASASVPIGILEILCECLIETNEHYMDYYTALIYAHMAHIQLHLEMTAQALSVLDKAMPVIMAHGGLYDRARVLVLYVKCALANDSTREKNHVLKLIETLEEAKGYYKKVEAFSRVKDMLYLQANLYNSINMSQKRNGCAAEFHLLNRDHKSQNTMLLKFL